MESDSTDDIWNRSAPSRHVVLPVACSVLLHAALFALVARAVFAPSAEARIAERPSLRVSVVMRPPPAPEPVAQQSSEPVESLQEEARAETVEVEEAAPPQEIAEAPAIANAPQADEGLATDAEVSSEETAASARAWTTTAVRAAIGTYVGGQRNAQIETWVAACILEQKLEHTRDCEQQRGAGDGLGAGARAGRAMAESMSASIMGRWRVAELTQTLETRKVQMKNLMDSSGPVGQLATDRFYLDLEIVRYLNGNPSPYGPRNQFSCGFLPCVYKFTGFDIERPEQEIDPDTFRVVPTLLGNSR
jgi:hypothetical protein